MADKTPIGAITVSELIESLRFMTGLCDTCGHVLTDLETQAALMAEDKIPAGLPLVSVCQPPDIPQPPTVVGGRCRLPDNVEDGQVEEGNLKLLGALFTHLGAVADELGIALDPAESK